MTRKPRHSLLKWELYKEKLEKELLGLHYFQFYSVFPVAFLSGCVVDCSLAPVVKNADAGQNWAAPLLILIFISAAVTGTIEACVSPYSCSWHREGARSTICCSSGICWIPVKGRGRGRRDPPKQPDLSSLHRQPSGAVAPFSCPCEPDCCQESHGYPCLLLTSNGTKI